jgi:hypothetical protein
VDFTEGNGDSETLQVSIQNACKVYFDQVHIECLSEVGEQYVPMFPAVLLFRIEFVVPVLVLLTETRSYCAAISY